MLTQDDLQKIGELIDSRTRNIVREETRDIVREEIKTHTRDIVREEIEVETTKLRGEIVHQGLTFRSEINDVKRTLKNMQVNINRISKKLGIIDELVDSDNDQNQVQYTKLEKRVGNLEKHLGVKPL